MSKYNTKFVQYDFVGKATGHYGVEVIKTDWASAPKKPNQKSRITSLLWIAVVP